MRLAALSILYAGIALAVLIGIAAGGDPLTLLILGFVLAFGALGIAVVRRSTSPSVGPAQCPECGGVISPNAPYCKHCGQALSA